MSGHHVQRVYLDRDESQSGRRGWEYTVDGGDPIGHRDFLAFLRKIGVRPKDIAWVYAGGMSLWDSEYADFTDEPDEEEDE